MSIQIEREAFTSHFNVPRGTLEKFDRYAELLSEWNAKFNLVSDSTLPQIWTRHFLDSAQLLKYIPPTAKAIADLGSGAGFPGIVLSIMGSPRVHLIEATGKKVIFLRTVIEELKLDAEVHQERVEDLKTLKPDVITARALAPLAEILKLSSRLITNDVLFLLLKGQKADAELTNSAKYWKFTLEKHRSISDPSGSVLILKELKFKHAGFGKNHRRKK